MTQREAEQELLRAIVKYEALTGRSVSSIEVSNRITPDLATNTAIQINYNPTTVRS